MTVKVSVPDYSNLIELATERASDIAVSNIQEEAVRNAPVDSGEYRRKIEPDFSKKEVVAKASHSAPVEYGTAPHIITPKNAKVLAFKVGGKQVFTKKVNHPGTKPNPIMRMAGRKVQKQIPKIFTRELNKLKG